jgi:hypothetical protein
MLPPGFHFPIEGPNEDGEGVVYRDDRDPATEEVRRMKTSCEQDRAALEYLGAMVGQRASYSVFSQSCRDFSENAFDHLDAIFSPKPERVRGQPPQWSLPQPRNPGGQPGIPSRYH